MLVFKFRGSYTVLCAALQLSRDNASRGLKRPLRECYVRSANVMMKSFPFPYNLALAHAKKYVTSASTWAGLLTTVRFTIPTCRTMAIGLLLHILTMLQPANSPSAYMQQVVFFAQGPALAQRRGQPRRRYAKASRHYKPGRLRALLRNLYHTHRIEPAQSMREVLMRRWCAEYAIRLL